MYGDNAKYIVIKPRDGSESIIIFSHLLNHSSVIKQMAPDHGVEVLSAGFINYKFRCWGESHSLKIASREEKDTKLAFDTFGITADMV